MNSPNDFEVILATREHDAMMREILEDSAFSGKIGVSYLREPSVYDSYQAEGKSYIFLLMYQKTRAVGMGVLTIRDILFEGRAARLGYLSGLRIRPQFRKRFLHMGAMYQRMYEMTRHEVDVYLTTILAENEVAIRLFEKKRRSMPRYQRVGEINTYFLGYKKAPALDSLTLYEPFTDGMPLGTLAAAAYMHADGVVGYTLDQSAQKVYKITGYEGMYRIISYLPLHHFGWPRFPVPGQSARYLSGGIYARAADESSIRQVVRALRSKAKDYDFLMLAALKDSVLDRVLQQESGAVCYRSILYQVVFAGATEKELTNLAVDVALL